MRFQFHNTTHAIAVLAFFAILGLIACSNGLPSPEVDSTLTIEALVTNDSNPTATMSPTPAPRILRICLSSEPRSLFIYDDNSLAGRVIRQAIYDGPIDPLNYESQPIITIQNPSLQNGGVILEPVQVKSGDLIADYGGEITNLVEGTIYRPSGCRNETCTVTFEGDQPVTLDQLVVRFELIPGLKWSDGAALTADDSVYSYELARSLYPLSRPGLVDRTDSYLALNETAIEWRGLPGWMDPAYSTNFYIPLPRHVWGELEPQELLNDERSTRTPLGWGAYEIEEWFPGERIELTPNPHYFRSSAGLPHFDRLVFQFSSDPEQALDELLSGACDLLDNTLSAAQDMSVISDLQAEGKLEIFRGPGRAWEHIDFGISSLDEELPPYFSSTEVRQAIAHCIDREGLSNILFGEDMTILDSYLSPTHPDFNPDVEHYSYDPRLGGEILTRAGWIDHDQDINTARIAAGIPGILDGTPFRFTYLALDDPFSSLVAQFVTESLQDCGLEAQISMLQPDEMFAPGPQGVVFGRQFAMAQYAWMSSSQATCMLYTTHEIPGPYPEFPKGWGGANATGFSQGDYDLACQTALNSIPDWDTHQRAHDQAQLIHSQSLPSIPLFLHPIILLARPDMCGFQLEPTAENIYWNLETYDYGDHCSR